jgi:hypothetical protein
MLQAGLEGLAHFSKENKGLIEGIDFQSMLPRKEHRFDEVCVTTLAKLRYATPGNAVKWHSNQKTVARRLSGRR